MSTAAQAFAPGSPAGGASAVAKLAGLPSSVPGLPSIPSLTQTSSADGKVTAGFDNSGFVVNFGGSASSGAGGMPQWLLIGAAALGAWMLAKKGRA